MKLILTSITQKDLDTITVELKDKKVTFDPRKHLQFSADFSACNEFMAEHATLIALTRTAEAEALSLESNLVSAKAKADGAVRSQWDTERDGKITEAAVTGRVRMDKIVVTTETELLEMRQSAAILQGLLSASSVKYAQVVAYLYTNSNTTK